MPRGGLRSTSFKSGASGDLRRWKLDGSFADVKALQDYSSHVPGQLKRLRTQQ
jgi:hypothetical protein